MDISSSHHIFDADHILHSVGPWALLAILVIVFIETGLPIGVVFPGDSILFTAGAMIGLNKLDHPLYQIYLVAFAASWLGGIVGFFVGNRAGPAFFNKPDSPIFNKNSIQKAHEFFDKYGGISVLLCRFFPLLRTFGPIFAGISQMDFKKFVIFNTLGSSIWCLWMPTLGYVLAHNPYMKRHVTQFMEVLVVLAIIGIGYEVYKAHKNTKQGNLESTEADPLKADEQIITKDES
ncbi:MAG: DedA family protein [Micrococcaceae bacterium]